jgi:hypothetical protein
MAMREQAATPAAAKRNWLACAQWRIDRFGVPIFWVGVQREHEGCARPEISRNRMVSFQI